MGVEPAEIWPELHYLVAALPRNSPTFMNKNEY
jgi:hypothetical protein